MAWLGRGQSSGCLNPVLDLYTHINGVLYDVASLEYVISENITTPGTPVQVFPVAGRATVDVAQDCPAGGRLGLGHYVADYSVGLTDATGEYFITWYLKIAATSPEQTLTTSFEVLPVMGAESFLYSTLQKVRDEGITVTQMSDARVVQALGWASQYIDRITGRHFLPQGKTLCLDGNCARGLLLSEPIIAVSEVRWRCCGDDATEGELISPDCYRVYNRHLTKKLTQPDDRDNPRIEFCAPRPGIGDLFGEGSSHTVSSEWRPLDGLGGRWPEGRQNIVVAGVFGYTDCDGTPVGKTPDLICRAATLLAIRLGAGGTGSASLKWQVTQGHRLKRERTVDQEYELFDNRAQSGNVPGRGSGPYTGDPEIDQILLMYKRPPLMATA